MFFCFFFSSRRRHTRCGRDWSSDVCSSDLVGRNHLAARDRAQRAPDQAVDCALDEPRAAVSEQDVDAPWVVAPRGSHRIRLTSAILILCGEVVVEDRWAEVGWAG